MATTRLTMAMALDSIACSQYLNFDYDSILVGPDGTALGFNEDGIFKLDTGDADESPSGNQDINAIIQYARSTMGFLGRKRIRAIQISGEFQGSMKLSVTGDETNAEIDIVATPNALIGVQTSLYKTVSSSVYGMHMDIKLENTEGMPFSIDAVDLFVIPQPHMT